jgi:hypothetical protein
MAYEPPSAMPSTASLGHPEQPSDHCEDLGEALSEARRRDEARDASAGNCSDHRGELIKVGKAAQGLAAEALASRNGDPVEQLKKALEHMVPIAMHSCMLLVCTEAYYRMHRPACASLEEYDEWCQEREERELMPAFRQMTGQPRLATFASELAEESTNDTVLQEMSGLVRAKLGEINKCRVCSTKDDDARLRYAAADDLDLHEVSAPSDTRRGSSYQPLPQ